MCLRHKNRANIFHVCSYLTFFTLQSHILNIMFQDFIQRTLSFGVDEKMEQSLVNRAKRINFFYLILIVMLSLSVIYSTFTGLSTVVLVNGIGLAITLLCYFYIPISRKADLSSMIVLSLTALIFLHGYLFNVGISSILIVAFYLLFPMGAVSVNRRKGIYVPIALGVITLLINSFLPQRAAIHLDLYNSLIFFSSYTLVILISLYLERSNAELLSRLQDSRSKAEDKVIQKDEFISKLSHKLRTSISNIALINSLVHDERLNTEQQDLMETLKASTNLLIEDVNNIVEIASPGIVDYQKSISSFDLTSVLENSLNILKSGGGTGDEVSISRTDKLNHYIIGDPSLLRSSTISPRGNR